MNAVCAWSALITTIVVTSSGAKVGPYKEHVFRTKIDHFGFHNNETFEIRYAVADQFWDAKRGPIFFYAGNEFFMESFIENTGLMWEWAPEMKALIIFVEHRFYGKSMPFDQESSKRLPYLGYLTTEQALADYADLLIHIKGTLPGAANCPVVAFGGSYGGMLAAWMRMKYPHLVTASLSSSAPLLMFPGLSPCSAFNRAITYAYGQEGPLCAKTVRKSWAIIESKFSSDESVKALRNKFKLCQELRTTDYVKLRDWLHDVYMVLAMLNYVDASTLLTPLPANPVKEACKFLQSSFASDEAIVDAVAKTVNLYFNGTGERSCNDIDIFHVNQTSWRFQECTELTMPTCSDGITDMFYPQVWNSTKFAQGCERKFAVRPDFYRGVMSFGGKNVGSASNIIFSHGDLDPWSSVGIRDSPSDSLPVIMISGAAHHSDLRFSTDSDPVALKAARELEKAHVLRWLAQAALADAKDRIANAVHERPLLKYFF
ncbi:lysosomal Pro-X carboxypeptidase [Dermacentor silvarum]|uniref:lysosomal Pro-X carboxypeptidase n=1 Tax=Dermacentor silvarum TaxID=543639 RepID=UPI0021007C2B|nr:lysosomal Pro-X carboxypeptidase [Dermacentor silvarum]